MGVLGTRKRIPVHHYLCSVKVERLLNHSGFSLFAKHPRYTLKRGDDIKVQEGSDSSKETKERNLETSKASMNISFNHAMATFAYLTQEHTTGQPKF